MRLISFVYVIECTVDDINKLSVRNIQFYRKSQHISLFYTYSTKILAQQW